jgi:hypothetical protein
MSAALWKVVIAIILGSTEGALLRQATIVLKNPQPFTVSVD